MLVIFHIFIHHCVLQDKEPKGIIPLENIQIRVVTDSKKPNCFELFATNNDVIKACKTDSEGKVVEGITQRREKYTSNFHVLFIQNFNFLLIYYNNYTAGQ